MTKPDNGEADGITDQPEGEPAAVRVRTDAKNEQDTAKAETTGAVEGKANHPKDTDNTVGTPHTGEGEAVTSDHADAGEKAEGEKAEGEKAEGEKAEGEKAEGEKVEGVGQAEAKRRISWSAVLAYGVLPGLALLLAVGAGYVKWLDSSARDSQIARIESVAAAKDSTIAMLSYRYDTVEKDLNAARDRLTGTFKDSYTQLINDVVIPGSKRERISTTANVPAAASVSATPRHAVTLLFVNQTATVDKTPPADTASSVRVTLDKVGGRWLISGFDPV